MSNRGTPILSDRCIGRTGEGECFILHRLLLSTVVLLLVVPRPPSWVLSAQLSHLDSRKQSEVRSLLDVASKGDTGLLELLVRRGADVNQANQWGWTPLMAAASNGQIDAARILLEHGAKLEARNANGGTALMVAAGNGYADTVRFLIQQGARLNSKTGQGFTALIFAAYYTDSSDTIRVLIESGANLKKRDIHGETALKLAASKGHSSVVKALLTAGALINARDHGGSSALMAAAANGRLETVRILLSAGADVDARQAAGWTALMFAAGSMVAAPGSRMYELSGNPSKNYNHDGVVRALLVAGADLNARNNEGATALSLALKQGRKVTERILKQAGATE